MTEKRSIANKYIQCSCDKNQEILLGLKIYKFINILCIPVAGMLAVLFLLNFQILWIIFVIAVALFITWLEISIFKAFKDDMLKAGHANDCSNRIAKLGTLYFGAHSQFTILDEESDRITT